MGSFAVRLSETAPTWARAVAPFAERIAHTLWLSIRKPVRQLYPATRLTESRRRKARGGSASRAAQYPPSPPRICRTCGVPLKRGRSYCASCAVTVSRENLIEAARLGRVATHSAEAEAHRAETQRRHAAARYAWRPSEQPAWLNEETYAQKIQPRLAGVTVPVISAALGISEPYATDIRAGRCRPHRRHWLTLAQPVGVLQTRS